MPSTTAEIPQFALPFMVTDSGREALVDQGTVEEYRQHAEAAARVRPGALLHDPEFGTTDQTFREGGPNTALLQAELSSCDPRPSIDVDSVMQAAIAVMTATVREGA